MAKRIKDNEVISKKIEGERKKLTSKKKTLNICLTLLNKYKVYFICSIILIIAIFITILCLNNHNNSKKVMTVDNYDYTKSDYMIYFYSAKYNYYGSEIDNITSSDLDIMYDDENKMTIKEYLKEVAISDIKTATAIKNIADKNNIELTDDDRNEIKQEKDAFIENLGGNKAYKKFLKQNQTTDEAYDKMSETDKLYKRIIKKLYSEGKVNDLTSDELAEAQKTYKDNYFKLKQIVLTKIDINTRKNLSSTAINQKETLANTIVSEAKNGANFDELIKKYSEAASDDDENFELYYKNGELLEKIEDEVKNLSPNEVSDPIKTDYAIHIILRLELDDSKLGDYYDDLREKKFIEDLKSTLDDLKIKYYDAYEKL